MHVQKMPGSLQGVGWGGWGGGVGVGENFFFDKCVGENCMHIMMENLGPCGTQGFNVCMQLVPWQNLYR